MGAAHCPVSCRLLQSITTFQLCREDLEAGREQGKRGLMASISVAVNRANQSLAWIRGSAPQG